MKYTIEGKVLFDVKLEVEANDEKQAYQLAEERLTDEYRLNYSGGSADGYVEFDLNAFNEADYPEHND